MQEFVKLQALKGFQHFFDHFLKILDKGFVINLDVLFGNQDVFLLDTLLLFLYNADEDLSIIVFVFNFAAPKIDHLS